MNSRILFPYRPVTCTYPIIQHGLFMEQPVQHLRPSCMDYSHNIYVAHDPQVLDLSKKGSSLQFEYHKVYPSPDSSPSSLSASSPSQSPHIDIIKSEPSMELNEIKKEKSEVYPEKCLTATTSPSYILNTHNEVETPKELLPNHSPVQNLSPALQNPTSLNKKFAPRPFKLLPKESPVVSLNSLEKFAATLGDISECPKTWRLIEDSVKHYITFKDSMLNEYYNRSKTSNQNMRRLQNNGDRAQDPEYLEKRRKNNEAAKRSRDARRQKQDESAIRAKFLAQENLMLNFKLQAERKELERLRNAIEHKMKLLN